MMQTRLSDKKEEHQEAAEGLAVVTALFQTLNQRGLRYCHWKSNLRLVDSLNGRTDLDLLVDPTHREPFRQILDAADIKQVLAPRGKRYPNLEDYLGFDPESGRQFHLHVHYHLVLGEQFVKNYQLPLAEQFLNAAVLCQGVKIPTAELELIVLSMRALLKYRDRDAIKDILTIRFPGVPDHITKEINWLLAQTSLEKVNTVLRELGDHVPADIIVDFLHTITTSPRDGRTLLRLRQGLRQALRPYQRYSRPWATLIYIKELWRRRNSFLRFKPPAQMTFPAGGLTLALVGVDGAGKTTLSEAVATWLAWKLDVHTYYLGSKQPSRLSEWSYLVFRMARRSQRELANRVGESNMLAKMLAAVRNTLLYSHYLFTGRDRFGRYRLGKAQGHQGSVVVYDRYPLEAPLDGPQIHLIAHDDKTRTAALLARMEQKLYRQMELPDLLIVLEVAPEISLQRKPDHQWETIIEKNQMLKQLTAAMEENGAQLVRLDASQPLDEVLSQVKEVIWQQLGGRDDR